MFMEPLVLTLKSVDLSGVHVLFRYLQIYVRHLMSLLFTRLNGSSSLILAYWMRYCNPLIILVNFN